MTKENEIRITWFILGMGAATMLWFVVLLDIIQRLVQ